MTTITFDVSKVIGNIANLSPGAKRAAVRGLNKTAANVKTEASKAIRQERPLPARVVKDAMAIKKASDSLLVSSIVVTGRPIPLRDYQARQTRAGVTAAVTRGKRKLVHFAGNNTFIVHKIGGHVFARVGKKRLPIKKLFGPSLPSTFLTEKVRGVWEARAIEVMPKRMAEEMAFELTRMSSRL